MASVGTGENSRRSFLGKAAVVGGAVWAAPVVQTFSQPAFADSGTSAPCTRIRGVKIEDANESDGDCHRTFTLANGNYCCTDIGQGSAGGKGKNKGGGGQGHCLFPGDDPPPVPLRQACRDRQSPAEINEPPPQGCDDIVDFVVSPEGHWIVTLDRSCTFCAGIQKAGQACIPFDETGGDSIVTDEEGRCVITFGQRGQEISHISLVFCCS